MSRKDNLNRIKERIAQAAQRVNRNPDDIKLVAVSKVFQADDIQSVYDLGVRSFGESRAQELRDKVPLLPQDIEWHFIGPLQSNKIKYVLSNARLVHAVDSLKLAIALAEYGKKNGIIPQILVEINTSAEKEKHGFLPGHAVDSVLEINALENIEVKGLMTMAPYTEDTYKIGKSFSMLYNLYSKLTRHMKKGSFSELSMGMSGDFEIAIEEGSTIVRIGTGIFGPRRR
jgi:pyridoxal phosphate enzyme (YggS family)